jgi:hypothetical protein
MNLKKKRKFLLVLPLAAVVLMVAGCGKVSPPSAMVAFVVGDGSNGHDNRVHNIVYPNQKVSYDDSSEIIRYVPSNSRNYIINDGSKRDANNHKVGDVHQPMLGYTSTGTPVLGQARAFWTLNESKPALMKFWDLCFKYTCASSKAEGGNANFATPGWNGMLGENFEPSMEAAFRAALSSMSDEIWQKHTQALYDDLATKMSENFAAEVQKTTGYNVDLFCGSGNSGWTDQHFKNYNCTKVRFIVDDIQLKPIPANSTGSNVNNTKLNEQRLNAAKALYGDSAGYWLGLQDTIGQCKQTKVACVINVGGNGNAVPVPTPTSGK